MHRVMLVAVQVSSMNTRRVGCGPGFVDEHKTLGIKIELAVEPGLPLAQDVRAVLLDRMACLFCALCRSARRSDGGLRSPQSGRHRQRYAKFIKRDVLAGPPYGEDFLPLLFDPTRTCVPALRLRRKIPGRATPRLPPDRRRRRHPKPYRRRPATHSRINRGQKPRAQIHPSREADPCMLASISQPAF